MLKKVLVVVVLLVVVLVAVVATRPGKFEISRSVEVNAPAEIVFANLNDFHRWDQWSPWAKRDPNQKTTYEGPAAGVGSKQSWAGNSDVGEGRMTIEESQPYERVLIKLEFLAPMKATNLTEFALKPQPQGVVVNWSMRGENDFMGKAFSMVMNMDKMVGGDFEKGLSSLKQISEAEAATRAAEAQKAAAQEPIAAGADAGVVPGEQGTPPSSN